MLAVLRARAAGRASCIQFGGQTPLKLARAIERAGFRILGTPYDAIDLAEDRERFGRLAARGSACAARSGGSRRPPCEAVAIAARIGYPVLVRPSYVLGGRAMRVCYDGADVEAAMVRASRAPVLVDRFLENAIELDVDALCDGDRHLRRRGDGARRGGRDPLRRLLVRPAGAVRHARRSATLVRRLGPALGVVGLLNVQLAIAGGEVYVLEVNPRASRTVPFASKATGVNLVDAACRLAAGATLAELGLPPESLPEGHHVKAAVLPFARFPGADPVLGPGDALDRRGDGERRRLRLGVREGRAGRRAAAADRRPRVPQRPRPRQGRPCCRSRGRCSSSASSSSRPPARRSRSPTTASRCSSSRRASRSSHLVRRRGVDLVVNTPEGRNARTDGYAIREAAVVARVPCITTLAVARAAVEAIEKALAEPARTLQERHAAGASLVASSRVEAIGPYALLRVDARLARSRACRASSSCSRRRAACCRGRCRSASRRAASWRS